MALILIADDNPHAHRMGRQVLTQDGHEVAAVSNGDEALKFFSERRPDLAMLDTQMPGINGFDVCQQVKSGGPSAQTKVILLAGAMEPFDPERARRAGGDAVLHKPLDAYSLSEKVKALLGGADLREEPETTASTSLPSRRNGAPSADLFATVVDQALGASQTIRAQGAEQVRTAVGEALQATLPALEDALTERILRRLDGK